MLALRRSGLGQFVTTVFALFTFGFDSLAQAPVGSVHEFGNYSDPDLSGVFVDKSSGHRPRAEVSEGLLDQGALNVVGVETTQYSGPSKNRIDLVFVGDGFSFEEMARFRELVSQHSQALFNTSPFREYRSFFNVHRVDVVSALSGVSQDPLTSKVGAAPSLGTSFSCFGNSRLLCANEDLVSRAALFAPAVDQIIVVANTETYGGAGYFSSGIAVYSALHSMASEIMIHELGHSFALLGDEYEVGGASNYSGPEVSFPNVSVLPASSMLEAKTKWFRWIGRVLNDSGGRVDTYEGAEFSVRGKYRPTANSKMRTLGEPFNPPSREAFIEQFYKYVEPIDSVSPSTTRLRRGRTLRVTGLPASSSILTVEWRVDGILRQKKKRRFKLQNSLGRLHHIEVRVSDRTSMVRDEGVRRERMTASHVWIENSMVTRSVPKDAERNLKG